MQETHAGPPPLTTAPAGTRALARSRADRVGVISRVATAVLLLGGAASCAPGTFEGTINSAATGPRVAALARIKTDGDRAQMPEVVECLTSHDPVVRHAAIQTLYSLTGETLDYRPDDPPLKRQRAVDRWVKWCRAEGMVLAEVRSNGVQLE